MGNSKRRGGGIFPWSGLRSGIGRLEEGIGRLEEEAKSLADRVGHCEDMLVSARQEVATLRTSLEYLRGELGKLGGALEDRRKEHVFLHEQMKGIESELGDKLGEIKDDVASLKQQEQRIAELEQQVKEVRYDADKADLLAKQVYEATRMSSILLGRLIESRTNGARAPDRGKVPAIAVFNVVPDSGKTTLTALIGAYFAKKCKKRVLLVDLDYKNSLSQLCLSEEQVLELRQQPLLVEAILVWPKVDGQSIIQGVKRVHDSDWLHLLASDVGMQRADARATEDWLGQQGFETCCRLRDVLTDEAVQGQYDLILLDFPSGVTMASLNGMAACNHVIIPAVLRGRGGYAVRSVADSLEVLLTFFRSFFGTCGDWGPKLVAGVVETQIPPESDDRSDGTSAQLEVLRELLEECNARLQFSPSVFPKGIPLSDALTGLKADRLFGLVNNSQVGGPLEALCEKLAAKIGITRRESSMPDGSPRTADITESDSVRDVRQSTPDTVESPSWVPASEKPSERGDGL